MAHLPLETSLEKDIFSRVEVDRGGSEALGMGVFRTRSLLQTKLRSQAHVGKEPVQERVIQDLGFYMHPKGERKGQHKYFESNFQKKKR